VAQSGGDLTVFTVEDRDYRADLGRALSEHGAIVQGMRVHETSLEEAFVTITEQHIREWTAERDREPH
jgi:hypothetical protein